MITFTKRYFLPLTTRTSASSAGFSGVPEPEYRVIADAKTLQRSVGDKFWCFVVWASNVVDDVSSEVGEVSLVPANKDTDHVSVIVVDISFASSVNIMDVSQDVIIGTAVVKAGVAKRGTWRRTASRSASSIKWLTIECDALCLVWEVVQMSFGS
jgi:hypothetical protein